MLTALLTSIVSTSLLATGQTPGIQLKKLTYSGRGCTPQGLTVVPNPDTPNRFAFKLPYMYAEAGPGTQPSTSRSSCSINLDFVVPDGWQLAISHLGLRGVATLDPEVGAVVSTRAYFQGYPVSMLSYEELISGPQDYYDVIFDRYPETPVWSTCGGEQSLSLTWAVKLIALEKSGGSGTFEFFYDMSEPMQTADIIWQPCGR